MPLPDFLVIGAAKSGTVSLYHYLGQHPQIYMCPVNEPNFFALDGFDMQHHFRGPGDRVAVQQHCVTDVSTYRGLFASANPQQQRGESSPLYLYSNHAAQRIHHHLPNVKLIALLRHPVTRAHATYRHYRIAGIEPMRTFEQALEAEPGRLAAGWGPWPFWAYRDVGNYAEQLQRYYTLFDRQQILVCFHEELRDDPVTLLQKIYNFIGVKGDYIPDTAVRHNIGTRPRNALLYRYLTQPNWLKDTLAGRLPAQIRKWLGEGLRRMNEERLTLNPVLRKQLTQDYARGIRRLQALTGHDLNHWLEE